MSILYSGIDVSKDKLDLAITQDGNRIVSSAAFDNNRQGFKRLFSWVKNHSKGFCNIHFCLESTGIYHEEITEFLQEQKNTIVSVINPFQAKAFAGSRLLRTKNDKVDSELLAFYCAISRPEKTIPLPDEVKRLRRLVRYLNTLIDNRAREKTRLHSVKDNDVAHVLKGTIKFYSQSITEVEKLINEHVKKHENLKHQAKLLKSIKSIGDKTAWRILAEIHIEDGKNLNVKAQVAHAGLAPKERQSGSSIKGKSRICKVGSANLRSALYMPAMSAIQNNPQLKEFYQRLISKGKLKMIALVAVMRKLLVYAIGVLRNNAPYDANWAKIQQEKFVLCA
jgi:transposase